MSSFVGYHNISAADHQARVNQLSAEGFRPTSLSVSGLVEDPRFAAIWKQRSGSPFIAVQGLNARDYDTLADSQVANGSHPNLITATGGPSPPLFAAVFETGTLPARFEFHGLRWDVSNAAGTINFENDKAFRKGYIPECLAVYGKPGEERFAGIWVKNTQPVAWAWYWADPHTYQKFFEASVQAGLRLSYVSVAPSGWILSVFRDEPIGEWAARHAITAAEYQAEFDTRTSQGLEPLVVQAGGASNDARYASIFVRSEEPIARQWRVTGEFFEAYFELDGIAQRFMTAHSIRAMSVAVARDGVLIANRGYTWAEPDYPTTEPDTLFRIASLSKIFTAAAAYQLVRAGSLTPTTPAFPFLGITSKLLPSQSPDPDVQKITVYNLAQRTSGLPDGYGTDFRTIARLLGRTTTPTRNDFVRYLYGVPLIARPNTTTNYSNSAFDVLTSVIEKAAQSSFLDYLRFAILIPWGISGVHIGATRFGARIAHEVSSYDSPGIGPSLLDLAPDAIAPTAYGGQFVMEIGEGAGGLVTSTGTVARMLAAHAVWDIGPRVVAGRLGEFDGTGAGANSRQDGIDFSYAFNRAVTEAEHTELTMSLNTLLDRLH